jgi:four helix bundle protein
MLKIYGEMLVMLRDVRPVIEALEKRDAGLADQMRRAAQSVVLNAAEGCYSRGRNSGARFQTSLASMRETLACIEVGSAFGYFAMPDSAVLDRIDKIMATLYRLVRG